MMEPRLVFDAAGGATAEKVVDQAMTQVATDIAAAAHAQVADTAHSADAAAHADIHPDNSSAALPAPADHPPAAHTLVLVDSRVTDQATLLSGIAPDAKVIIVDQNQDGLAVITQALATEHDVSSVQIFAHGGNGLVTLGRESITAQSLTGQNAEMVRSWAGALTADADILIYGCSVAQDATGRAFIDQLSALSKADVAASIDDIGRSAGTSSAGFSLEYATGTIESSAALSQKAMADYSAHLAATPTIADTVGTAIRIIPEDTLVSLGHTLSVGDADSTSLTISLRADHGTFSFGSTAGLTFTQNTAAAKTFTGSLADINAALGDVRYQGVTDYFGSDTLHLTATDSTSLSASKDIALNITPVNDAPTVSPTPLAVPENIGSGVSFSAANFGISDVDNSLNQVIARITATPQDGYLELSGSRLGIGSTFDATQLSNIKYFYSPADPNQQVTNPSGKADAFIVTVDDGAGGQVADVSIPVTIMPINTAPTVTGVNRVYEGQTNFPVSISIADPDQGGGPHSIEITSLPSAGVLKYNGVAVSVGQIFSSADMSKLTYDAAASEPTPASQPSFGVRVTDDGGGTGTPSHTDSTITLTVLPNNDDPVLALDTGATLLTSTSVTIDGSKLLVTDVDTDTSHLTYTVTNLPAEGVLLLTRGGVTYRLLQGASFTQEELDSGSLSYKYLGTTPGTIHDPFSFTVRDGQMRAWPTVREGGIYADETTTTLQVNNFDIVVDASVMRGDTIDAIPTLGPRPMPTTIADGVSASQLSEGDSIVLSSANINVTAPDTPPSELIIRITSLPAGGSVLLNGHVLGLYSSFTMADVEAGRVSFQHDGSEHFTTQLGFSASDGQNTVSGQSMRIDITPVNDNPTLEAGRTTVTTEGGAAVLGINNLTISDVDGTGDQVGGFSIPNSLSLVIQSAPAHGQLMLNGVVVTAGAEIPVEDLNAGKLTYTHDGSEVFTDTITFIARDNHGGESAAATVTIKVSTVNDDPAFSDQVFLEVKEGGSGTINGSNVPATDPHIVFVDPDNSNLQRQYRITGNTANGTLYRNGQPLGTGSVFSQEDLNNGLITYTHSGDETRSDSFSYAVRDGGGGVINGTYNITVTGSINDAPTVNGPGTVTFATLTPFVFNGGNTISITDAEISDGLSLGETDVMRVTVDLRDGGSTLAGASLTLGSTAGITFIEGADGAPRMVIEGTLSSVNAALAGLQMQVPADMDKTLTLRVIADDRENGGATPDGKTVGVYNVITKDIAVKASNVNDAPTITAPAAIIATEDTIFSAFTGTAAVSVGDADDFGGSMTVTLNVAHGTVSLASLTNLTGVTGNNTATLSFSGDRSAVNAALATLRYQGTSNYNGSDSLHVTVEDNGNLGTGGSQSSSADIAITVKPVNDSPSMTAPAAPFTLLNGNTSVAITGVSIDDASDIGQANFSDSFSVTVSCLSPGMLGASGSGGATLTGLGSNALTIAGTRAQVNDALSSLSFSLADPAANDNQSFTVTMTVHDQANGGTAVGGSGGDLTAAKTVTINVSDINTAPSINGVSSVTATEDTSFAFSGANVFSVADPDSFGGNIQTVLTVDHGTLSSTGTLPTGLTVVFSNGNRTATLTGTITAINSYQSTNLRYQGNLNFNGSDTLHVSVDDLGSANGSSGLTAAKDIAITVNPVNDLPTLGSVSSVTMVEGGSVTLASTITFSDVELSALAGGAGDWGGASISLARLGGANAQDVYGTTGTLSFAGTSVVLNGVTVGTINTNTGGSLNLTFAHGVTNAQAQDVVRQITYSNTSDVPPASVGLNLNLNDGNAVSGGAQGSGGPLSTNRTLGVNITAVNDAPTLNSLPASVSFTEDGAPVGLASTAVIGDPELVAMASGNGNWGGAKVTISRNGGSSTQDVFSASGTLAFSGSSVTLGGTTVASLTSNTNGVLSLTFANGVTTAQAQSVLRQIQYANTSDAPPSSATMDIVINDGNATSGGAQGQGGPLSVTRSVVVNITPNNDAPTITGLTSPSFTEGGSPVVLAPSAIVSDPEIVLMNGGNGDWANGSITITRSGGANAQDVFGASGTLSISGTDVLLNGTHVATVTNANGSINIQFDSGVTTAQAQAVLRQITYSNSSESPSSSVPLTVTINDGNTGLQGAGGAKSSQYVINVNVTPLNDAPLIDSLPASVNYVENGSAIVLAPTATLADYELSALASGAGDWGGASFNLERLGGPNAKDVFGATGTLSFSGSTVTLNGANVGTITANSGGTFTIRFNSGVTTAQAQDVVRQLTYSSTDNTPPTGLDIKLTINDGNAATGGAQGSGGPLTNTQTVRVNVTAVNDAPDIGALPASTSFTEGGSPATLASNATLTDPELSTFNTGNGDWGGATLTIMRNGGASAQDVFGTTGTLSFNGTSVLLGGMNVGALAANTDGTLSIRFNAGVITTQAQDVLRQITYSNTSDMPPASISLALTVNDGNAAVGGVQGAGGALKQTRLLQVNITPVNDLPAAQNDGATVKVGTGPASGNVLTNDSDPDGDTLFVTEVNGQPLGSAVTGSYGALTLNPDGSYSYAVDGANPTVAAMHRNDPPLVDTFTYRISDGHGGFDTATLTIRISGPDNRPIIVEPDRSVTMAEDSAPTALAITAPTDPEGDPLTITVSELPDHGTILLHGAPVTLGQQLSGAQIQQVTFQPAADYNGPAGSFRYTVADDHGASSQQAVTFTVTPVNDAPRWGGISTTEYPRQATSVPLAPAATIFDPELSVLNGGAGDWGGATLTLARNGGASAQDTFGASGTLEFAGQDVLLNGAHVGSMLSNGNGVLAVRWDAGVTTAQAQQVVRQLTYTNGAAMMPASVDIAMTINDGNSTGSNAPQGAGGPLERTQLVHVVDSNKAPTAVAEERIIAGNTTTPLSVTRPVDADGDPLGATVTGLPSHGVLQLQDGSIVGLGQALTMQQLDTLRFVPDIGFSGDAGALSFNVSDGRGGTAQGSVAIRVTPVPVPVRPAEPVVPVPPADPVLVVPAIPGDVDHSQGLSILGRTQGTKTGFFTNPWMTSDPLHYELYLVGSAEHRYVRELSSFQFIVPQDIFRHDDPTARLSFTARRTNGAPLPAWLHFDAATLTFHGIPPEGAQSVDVIIVAKDSDGREASATFRVVVKQAEDDDRHTMQQTDAIKLRDKPQKPADKPGGRSGPQQRQAPQRLAPQKGQRAMNPERDADMALEAAAFKQQLDARGGLGLLADARALIDSLSRPE